VASLPTARRADWQATVRTPAALRLSSKDLPEAGLSLTGVVGDEGGNDDAQLEKQMALEQYNALKGSDAEDELLQVTTFLQWEEIVDVLEIGVVDLETMEIVLKESGVTSGFMTFPQFQEVVELVNQLTISLEMEDYEEDPRFPSLPEVDVDEADPAEAERQVEAMLAAMGVKKRQL